MNKRAFLAGLRAKADGKRNAVGDHWGDWICAEAAAHIESQDVALRKARDDFERIARNSNASTDAVKVMKEIARAALSILNELLDSDNGE